MMFWIIEKKMFLKNELSIIEEDIRRYLHPDSPLFGKDKMATFERYFLQDAETHTEKKNPYYSLA